MTTTNYFKTPSDMFFFDDNDRKSVDAAYREAIFSCGTRMQVSIFRPASLPGPWDESPLIGHRRIEAIQYDIQNSEDGDDRLHARYELDQLREEYLKAGRKI